MDRTLLEAAYVIETAATLERGWQAFLDALARLKLDKVIYITRSDRAMPDWRILSSLPGSWPKTAARDPAFSEPFVTFCCATFEPTKLGPDFLETHDTFIDDYTRDYVASMQRFDWRIALGIPCCLKGSGRHGGFIVGNNMSLHEFERAVIPKIGEIQSLSLIAHRKFDGFFGNKSRSVPSRPLSPREYQVMELLTDNLKPKAIAVHLGLSESSIRLYLKNARTKLGAASKEEALLEFAARFRS